MHLCMQGSSAGPSICPGGRAGPHISPRWRGARPPWTFQKSGSGNLFRVDCNDNSKKIPRYDISFFVSVIKEY